MMGKNYSFPTQVIDGMIDYFFRFTNESMISLMNDDGTQERLPVMWHQMLLIFVQKYKEYLDEVQKKKLKLVMRIRCHPTITEEIRYELFNEKKTQGIEMID